MKVKKVITIFEEIEEDFPDADLPDNLSDAFEILKCSIRNYLEEERR